ncbi:probable receptor-like protein kinase At1g80640 [Phragmites australis]|uniref:probable receptor-like protein kinase At1g80640 n=1 Tax=Phragmites australis TaxID=29695 RepID=UPI002D7939BC|nr:probable receptor-like protein kinase At1g80640 [Phragmites australis]
MVVPGGGSFLLLLLPSLLGGTALLADAARVVSADVSASSPPAPSPAADAPFLPDVMSPEAARVQTGGDNHYLKQVLVAVILALVAVIVIVVSAIYAWTFWRKAREALNSKDIKISNANNGNMLLPVLGKLNLLKMSKKEVIAMMDFSVLESATGKFNEKNILGKGGFGCVYRACLDRSHVAAVKKLDCCRQEVEKEFENELDFLGKIRHPNVISVLGYCIHEDIRLLVYELMQNGSLETQLHGPSRGSALSWHIRLKIALDAARGLEHLHEHCHPMIIHRDIKSSNILLDTNFNAKISDFGLAIYGGDHNKDDIKPSGTVGYVAPEYLLDGQLTEKSDVYAFGVVLLELLLGRKPVEMIGESHCQSIVSWAMPQITDRTKLPNIIDPVIRKTMDLRHLYQVAAVAVLCVQPEPSYRPLIADVLHSLVPLVPVELGGTMRVVEHSRQAG